MGLFDVFKGKKDKGSVVVLESAPGGYALKFGNGSSGISRACIYFSLSSPLEDEQDMVEGIIKELDASIAPAAGAIISTAYEILPDIDEFVATREIPDTLNTFLMSRAMMLGLARGPAEMAKLAIEPFNYNGIKGVIILKEA